MGLSSIDRKRLIDLEEILEIHYEKLAAFEQDIVLTSSPPQKFELTQRLKREVIPSIREYQLEYTSILCKDLQALVIPEVEANNVLKQVSLITQKIQRSQPDNQTDELTTQLANIQKKLDDPGKSATAKLKLTLPVIPLLASYEMDVDTEAFLVKTWQGINGLVRRFWK